MDASDIFSGRAKFLAFSDFFAGPEGFTAVPRPEMKLKNRATASRSVARIFGHGRFYAMSAPRIFFLPLPPFPPLCPTMTPPPP